MNRSAWGAAALALLLLAPPALADGGTADTSVSTAKKKKKRKKRNPDEYLVEQQLKKGTMGLEIGFTSAYLECDCTGDPDYNSEWGLVAGIVYDKALNRFLSYHLGGRYHGKGAKDEADNEYTLRYAEV
ncbi:MAG: hypothetical protein KC620_22960, partial [Myxococcales bacterium]|nr:hypothetical protein [Myxococcales bacterium]